MHLKKDIDTFSKYTFEICSGQNVCDIHTNTISYIRCSFENTSNMFAVLLVHLCLLLSLLHVCIQLLICLLLGGAIFQRIQAEVWLLQKEAKEAGKNWSVFRDIIVSSFLSRTVFLDTLIYSVGNPCWGVKSIFVLHTTEMQPFTVLWLFQTLILSLDVSVTLKAGKFII